MRQLGLGAGPSALLGERADVHFVNHLMRKSHPAPILVGPSECGCIDHFRPPVRALGLESRRRIRTGFATIQLKFVARAAARVWRKARKIARRLRFQQVPAVPGKVSGLRWAVWVRGTPPAITAPGRWLFRALRSANRDQASGRSYRSRSPISPYREDQERRIGSARDGSSAG